MNYEKPNPYLYSFTGYYQVGEVKVGLDNSNFILRGCSLRNCNFIYGLVAYTGHDTKLLLNSVSARAKKSAVVAAMDLQVL